MPAAPPPLAVVPAHRAALASYLSAARADASSAPREALRAIVDDAVRGLAALPSGHVVDRSVIQRHLLSDENDPFSRAKLTVDMLVPDAELKEKIDEWRASKRRASAEGAMDTS